MNTSTLEYNKGYRGVNRKTREYKFSKVLCELLVKDGILEPLAPEHVNAHKRIRSEAYYDYSDYKQVGQYKVRAKFGRYAVMTPEQKEKFLECLRLGMNEAYSADFIKVSWNAYGRTRQADTDFVKEVQGAKEMAEGQIEHVIYESGINGSVQAAATFLNVRRAVEQGKFTRQLERGKLKLKKQEVDSKTKAVDHIVSQAEGRVNFHALSDDELKEYSRIYDLMKSMPIGVELSDEDAIIFARLTRKISVPLPETVLGNGNGKSVHALNGISKIDQMMDDEEDE